MKTVGLLLTIVVATALGLSTKAKSTALPVSKSAVGDASQIEEEDEVEKLLTHVSQADEVLQDVNEARMVVGSAVEKLRTADPVRLVKKQIEASRPYYLCYVSENKRRLFGGDEKLVTTLVVPGFKRNRMEADGCGFEFRSIGVREPTEIDMKTPVRFAASKYTFATRFNVAMYHLTDDPPETLELVDSGLTWDHVQQWMEMNDEQWQSISDVTKVRIKDQILANWLLGG